MYNIKSNLIIGFHGCDMRIRDKLLTNPNEIRISTKPYDWPISINKNLKHDSYRDKILRERDCAVIEYMHQRISIKIRSDIKERGISSVHPFDSVRGAFTEGGPAFEGAGLHAKTHIQLCIRNMNCIRGFFLPRKETAFAPIFPFS